MEQKLQQLRAKIKQRKKGSSWHPELRAEILHFAKILHKEHRNWRKVSELLGITYQNLYVLRLSPIFSNEENTDETKSFAVAILEEDIAIEKDNVVGISVTSPNGFQLQGLNFIQAIKAMEVLSCSK